ncbi:CDP-diacylglycerol--serine O-phosphatidyltransferase [Mesorhizobium sp. Z1-4]|uniref:CDP-diacylglycerol--serine O-phosphatidyltransferase n=1 Tax=Mesorhizobium sp. Z1-4 TaxID=2448478 RepID=UPI000FDB78E6|nr:CDP-diacylglycerol--serine O-phosphatidyltransferase [Mesorhizobium sp. Z1-4]
MPSNEPEGPKPGFGGPRIREIPLRLVIPNLITVMAICAGLTGIRLAFEGRFELAVAMVLFAAALDALDGRTARMLKASSKFGAQMDSLADVINFGVAPAMVLYPFLLHQLNSLGWIAALIFAIACALRLARFNVMAEDPDRPVWQTAYFVGIPAPAGAVLVLLPVYIGFLGAPLDGALAPAAAVYCVLIALLMVSRIRVWSGKAPGQRINRDSVPFFLLCAVLLVMLFVAYTWYTLTAVVVAYLVFLPFSALAYRRREAAENAE